MIIFDIDGTLSIVGKRIKYLQQPKKDWDNFYANCYKDALNEPIAEIYRSLMLSSVHPVKVLTGRRESERDMTLQWFNQHSLRLSTHNLYMRTNKDYRPDYILKEEIAKNVMSGIVMAFDDRQQVVDMWRRNGVTCLQVAEGNF